MGDTEQGVVSNTPSAKRILLLFFFLIISTFAEADRVTVVLTLPNAKKNLSSGKKMEVVSVIKEGAEVYSLPSPRSILYYKCPQNMLLAVAERKNGWLGILMMDGSVGWIKEDYTKPLPYIVKTNIQPTASQENSLPYKIIKTALNFLGVPYRWGGTSSNGFDCSGFVQKIFALNGISLPRRASEQFKVGYPVPIQNLRMGDRLYFINSRTKAIDHTGIYIGNGYFIHSASSRGGVSIDNLSDKKWRSIFLGAKRL